MTPGSFGFDEDLRSSLVRGQETRAQLRRVIYLRGMFKDDPDFNEVPHIMAENRRKMDKDPKIPCAWLCWTPTS